MNERKEWRSTADEFISFILQKDVNVNVANVDKCRRRALELLQVIKDEAVASDHIILLVIDALRCYVTTQFDDQGGDNNRNNHKDDDDCDSDNDKDKDNNVEERENEKEKVNKFTHAIVEILRSNSIEQTCKIHIIQFINLVLSKFSLDDDENMTEAETVYEALTQREEYYNSEDVVVSMADAGVDNIMTVPYWDEMLHLLKSKENITKAISSSSLNNETTRTDAESIKAAGDYAAEKLYLGSELFKKGLSQIVPKVTDGIEHLGKLAKQNIKPASNLKKESEEGTKDDDQVVAVTEASVHATDIFRESAKVVAFGIRDYSTKGINKLTEKWEENELGKELCPENELREAIALAGKVSIASIGATVNVAESIFEATKAVAQTSVKVTADVAQHAYGGNTGAVIENTGKATGNVLRGVTHIGMLEGQVLSKAIVRNTAKVNMDQTVNEKVNHSDEKSRIKEI